MAEPLPAEERAQLIQYRNILTLILFATTFVVAILIVLFFESVEGGTDSREAAPTATPSRSSTYVLSVPGLAAEHESPLAQEASEESDPLAQSIREDIRRLKETLIGTLLFSVVIGVIIVAIVTYMEAKYR